jgi:hypothetical protein
MCSLSRGLRRDPYIENRTDPGRASGSGSGIGVDLTGFEADAALAPSDITKIIGPSLVAVTQAVERFAWVPSARTKTTVVAAMIPHCSNWLMFRQRSTNRSIFLVNCGPVERRTRSD